MTRMQKMKWMIQEARFMRAKRKAEKFIRRTDACIFIMNDAYEKQKMIREAGDD